MTTKPSNTISLEAELRAQTKLIKDQNREYQRLSAALQRTIASNNERIQASYDSMEEASKALILQLKLIRKQELEFAKLQQRILKSVSSMSPVDEAPGSVKQKKRTSDKDSSKPKRSVSKKSNVTARKRNTTRTRNIVKPDTPVVVRNSSPSA